MSVGLPAQLKAKINSSFGFFSVLPLSSYVCDRSSYFSCVRSFLQNFIYRSLASLPCATSFLIPLLDSALFSECLVNRFREYTSAVKTTAHLLSLSYPLLISFSPSSCCSISPISVLTEAHFRWSVLLRHVPFSSARTTFFHISYKALSPSDLLSVWRLKLNASFL